MVARPDATASSSAAAAWAGPWLFADLAAAFAGRAERRRPGLGQVRGNAPPRRAAGRALRRRELRACRDIRKHIAWYLKGYAVGHEARAALALVESLEGFDGSSPAST